MITMRFEGGDKLAAELQSLSVRASKGVLREALEEYAAKPIQQRAKATVKVDPGEPDLADHIVISTAKASAGPAAAVAVGPSTETRSNQPKVRYDRQARFLEYGTAKMTMRPFMRPAFDGQVQRAVAAIRLAIWSILIRKGIVSEVSR